MAPDINAEHSFFSIALHVHPEVVCEGWRYRKHSESARTRDEVSGTVSVSNQHVISIHAQNDELFIGLESESPKFVKIDWRSIVTFTKNITHALVSSLDELWLLAAHPVAKCLSPEEVALCVVRYKGAFDVVSDNLVVIDLDSDV